MPWHSGGLWYAEPKLISNAVGYAQFYSRSHEAVVCVYDEAGTVIETHEHTGESKCGKFLPSVPKTLRHLRLPDPWLSL